MRSKLGILAVLATLFTTVFAGSASAREHYRVTGYSRYQEHDREARREREFRLARLRERERFAGRRCW